MTTFDITLCGFGLVTIRGTFTGCCVADIHNLRSFLQTFSAFIYNLLKYKTARNSKYKKNNRSVK